MKKTIDFTVLLEKFDAFLKKNKLPIEKIWLRARHTHFVDPTGESREGKLYLYLPKEGDNQRDAQYDQGLSIEDIKRIYSRAMSDSGEYAFGFFVIAVIDGKTVCGVLGDWFGFPDELLTLEFYRNNAIVFSCHDYLEWWKDEYTLISEISEWKEIRKKPVRLSNLDYLFDW